jgi:hypothetical protein
MTALPVPVVRAGRREQWWLPVVALLCALAMLGYITAILIPHQVATSAAQGVPRGNLSDLYPRWLGTREVLQHGRNPYSAEVTRDIQLGYYGVALTPGGPIHDQQGFAYPLYVVFLLAPLTLFPFDVVQPLFGWALLGLTALSVPLWLRAIGWTLPRPALGAAALLAAGSWPALQGWALEQLTLLVAALLAAAAACLAWGTGGGGWGVGGGGARPGNPDLDPKSKIPNPPTPTPIPQIVAGALLAVATIKPQVTALLVAGLAVWVLGHWRARQGVVWGFLGTLAALVGGSFLLLPGWLDDFRAALVAYQQYTDGHSLLWIWADVGLGRLLPAGVEPVTNALAAALVAVALGVGGGARGAAPATFPFARALALTLAITLLIIPTWAPYNQPVLLPAILLLVQYRAALWAAGRRWVRWAWVTAAAMVGWPWLAAAGLLLALPIAAAAGQGCCDSAVYRLDFLPLLTSLFTPLAVLAALAGLWTHGLPTAEAAHD